MSLRVALLFAVALGGCAQIESGAPDAGDTSAVDDADHSCDDIQLRFPCFQYGRRCVNTTKCPGHFFELECGYGVGAEDTCGMCWRGTDDPTKCPAISTPLDSSGCPFEKNAAGLSCGVKGKECVYRDLCPKYWASVLYCGPAAEPGKLVWRRREDPC